MTSSPRFACLLPFWFSAQLLLAAGEAPPPAEDSVSPTKRDIAPAPWRSEEVGIESDSIVLAGTLLVPLTPAPHPGIVLLPGSGPHTRDHARPFAERFASSGYEVIFYDKRGNGGSGGDWTRASLVDLAKDGLAALGRIASREGVDRARIGLWAPSQGAWVASVMTTMTSDIAFLVVISGGGLTPREVETWAHERRLDRLGASPPDRAEAHALIDAYFDYLATGEGRARLIERMEADRARPWYEGLGIDRVLPSDGKRSSWEWVARFDPRDAIAGMKMPILLIFGGRDEEQPSAAALARWEEGLDSANNNRWVAAVFGDADHGIRVRPADGHPEASADEARTAHGEARDAPFAAAFLETVTGWIRVQGGLGEPARVEAHGSLMTIMHEGLAPAEASLAGRTSTASIVAVGALSDLRGEITVIDGRVHLSLPDDVGGARTEVPEFSGEDAALLVIAEVPRWIDVTTRSGIPFEGFDDAIRALARRVGLDTTRPFPFVVEGVLRELEWHTIDGRRIAPGGAHGAHARAGIREERATADATLVGFYSTAHEGVFTHRGASTHVHVVARGPLASGHLDRVTIPAGATVRLPAP